MGIKPERFSRIVGPDNTASKLACTQSGNREALSWLRGEQSVFVPEENREQNVSLIDFEHLDSNIFQVADEWVQQGTVFRNRADVVFLVNGIPVALAETKAPEKSDALSIGIRQIRRYHSETPEMFVATQVFEVTELVRFWYGVTWNTSRKNLFDWRDEQPGNYERKVKAFFDRARFLRLLREYIVFLSKDDEITKMILRQHQTRAAEKVIDRVHDPAKRRGLIWHTQGSGKTLTMLAVASKLLREAHGAEKPTVLMLVDRNELESQLFKNVVGYGIGVRVAESKRDVRDILGSDYRGLVMRETAPEYLPLARGWDDKAKERAIDHFADKELRTEFFKFFRQLQNLYDVISPDAFLRPFLEDYLALSDLYALIRNAYTDRPYVDKELSAKTKELLKEHTASGKLEMPGAIHELGPKELAALKSDDATDTVKILNLRKILTAVVTAQGASKPFLLSIGERAEALATLYEDRQLTTQAALATFVKLGEEYVESETERSKLGVDENTFAIYTTLRAGDGNFEAKRAEEINALFGSFPDYRWNKEQESKLRTALYKALRPIVGTGKMIEAANNLLKLQRV